MPSENATWRRFNDSMVPGAVANVEWRFTQRDSAPGANAMIQRVSRPYITLELNACKLNEAQKDDVMALLWSTNGTRRVLARIAAFCEIGLLTGYDANGAPVYVPSYQFTGDGTAQTFQLRKPLVQKGYENDVHYYDVKKPHWDYPALLNWRGVPASTNLQQISFHGAGPDYTLIDNANFNVNRDTGVVSTSISGPVYTRGGFYVLMLFPTKLPIRRVAEETGTWYVLGDVSLEEPPGG